MLAAAGIAIVAIVTGCGGDDDDSTSPNSAAAGSAAGGSSDSGSGSSRSSTTTKQSVDLPITTSSLSKSAFVKKANAICAREDDRTLGEALTYLKVHGGDGLPNNELNANLIRAVMAPGMEAEIAAVSQLGAPKGDEKQIEAILTAQQAVIDELKELKQVKSSTEFQGYFGKVGEEFRAYGLKACAKD
jgi:hypothetical protein